MAVPNSRATFTEYCLRKLGKPVIEINVDDDQVSDRIDEAIRYYWDYHFDGTDKIFYKHALTQDDIDNRYLQLPDNIIGAVNIFPVGNAISTNNMFNIRYQIALNDLYTLTSVSMVPYTMMMTHIQFLEQFLVGQQPLRYNRVNNKLYVDMDWTILGVGMYMLVEAYQVVDPEEFTKTYAERWLQNYATVLIKEQWGTNMKKFKAVALPGGIMFSGQEIYDEAVKERQAMEYDMIHSFSTPVSDAIG